ARAERLQSLLDESTRTVRQLLQANQELSTSNAEMRSTNEELLVGNEEAQAAIEEIETLSEEQQAANEELETLNEELQATVEELSTTNDDLEARGVELVATGTALEAQRRQLAAVLSSMADGVLVVNRAGAPLLTNAAFERLVGEAGAAFVPQDERGEPLPADMTPQQRAARGEIFSMQFTLKGADGTRRYF